MDVCADTISSSIAEERACVKGVMHPLREVGGMRMNSAVGGASKGAARESAPLAGVHFPMSQSCEVVRTLTSSCTALRGQRGGEEEESAGTKTLFLMLPERINHTD